MPRKPSAKARKRGRPKRTSPYQNHLIDHIRSKIIAGELKPGEQLPRRHDLQKQFKVSYLTVQRAVTRLVNSGYLKAIPSQGTFVSQRPPHLYRYAIILPFRETDPEYVKFWDALKEAAQHFKGEGAVDSPQFDFWEGIGWEHDTEEFRRLEMMVEEHFYGGILFTTEPFQLKRTSLLEYPSIPRVAIRSKMENNPHLGEIIFNSPVFFERAMERLARKGCRRLAMIAVPGHTQYLKNIDDLCRRYCIEMPPGFLQYSHQHLPFSAYHIVRLLLEETSLPPEGLIVSDDNLEDSVIQALKDLGVSVPRDLQLVVHCNFPAPPSPIPSIDRLGYDATEILRSALAHFRQMRETGHPLPATIIQPCFENELR
ncbi:MAG: GntR family transcriptional regulator [Lentisphaerae bacterium]|nr:MAG: GntR family transcriptional regulator [Lentisphaerota bacterium]